MDKVSAVIITKNEAANIRRCLESIQPVADEIIVVDAFSDDETPDICREFGAKVIQKAWEGYSQNKNFGNEQARYDHILSIDADEALSPELAQNILAEKKKLRKLYTFNRLTNYCDQWIHHCGWYPDKKLRLFDKRVAAWDNNPVHEEIKFPPDLKAHHIAGDLLHYSFKSLSDHIKRLNQYSNIAAQKLHTSNAGGFVTKLLVYPPLKFVKCYLLKKGFLDGFYGICICTISAFDVFIRYAKAIKQQKSV